MSKKSGSKKSEAKKSEVRKGGAKKSDANKEASKQAVTKTAVRLSSSRGNTATAIRSTRSSISNASSSSSPTASPRSRVFQRVSAKLVGRAAEQFGIGFSTKGVGLKPQIREVLFLDTADFRLYNNAFILRRRITYERRLPRGRPGDRLQVPASGHAEGRGAGRAAEYRGQLPDQVQSGSPAAERSARRIPPAVLAQCRVRPEPGARAGSRVAADSSATYLPALVGA